MASSADDFFFIIQNEKFINANRSARGKVAEKPGINPLVLLTKNENQKPQIFFIFVFINEYKILIYSIIKANFKVANNRNLGIRQENNIESGIKTK